MLVDGGTENEMDIDVFWSIDASGICSCYIQSMRLMASISYQL